MAEFDWTKIRTISAQMVENDIELRNAQYAYERMSRLEYELPEPMNMFEWIHPVKSPSPYNALRGATLALSNLAESLNVMPPTIAKALPSGYGLNSRKAYEIAAGWEAALKWQTNRAARRRKAFRSTAMWSASLYHEIVAQLIHLPTQFAARKANGVRETAALRFGDWAIRMCDPKTVHLAYSDYMTERALLAVEVTAQQLVDEFGMAAREIGAMIEEDPAHAAETYMKFDFTNYDARAIWVVRGAGDNLAEEPGIVIQEPEPWMKDEEGKPVPFLPWIAAAGGVEIDAKPEHQRKPILYAVYQAELWTDTNIFGTLMYSDALQDIASSTDVFKGPGADKIRVDRSKPRARINLNPLQTYEQIKKAGLEPAFREAFDRFDQVIRTSTVAEVLISAQPAENIAAGYAFSLQIQAALASLGDIKSLGETFLERVYETILLITHYRGGQIVGYNLNERKQVSEQYTIDSEDIDPAAIYLEVKLKPDVPSEQMQQVTAASNLSNVPGVSPYKVLEILGDTDPDSSIREWKYWRMDMADLEGYVQRIQAEASGQYQQDVAAAAQAMLEERMAAEQQAAKQQPDGAELPEGGLRERPAEIVGGPPGMEGVEGDLFNPEEGGLSALQAGPATAENQTGQTRAGTPIPGLGL